MIPLSNSKCKEIASLKTSKGRRAAGLFAAEGDRAVRELADAAPGWFDSIIALPEWWDKNGKIFADGHSKKYIASEKDIKKISSLTTPPQVVAIFTIPAVTSVEEIKFGNCLTLALDGIQDPGNLGTIIRLADWWGVEHILCSKDTADCYNPKVIQSTMGAIGRVKIIKTESLASTLRTIRERFDIPVYGTFLDGENLFTTPLSSGGIIVMGNEGNGISPDVSLAVTKRLNIPSWPPNHRHVESLNVAVATAVTLSCFRATEWK